MKLDLSTITITEISCLKFLKKSKYKDKNYKKVLTNQRGYDIIEVY